MPLVPERVGGLGNGSRNGALVSFSPFWETTDHSTVRLYLGNVVDVLKKLPAKSVQCVVTSPPYWGLRSYATGKWVGGDSACKHSPKGADKRTKETHTEAVLGYDGVFSRRNTRTGDGTDRGHTKGVCSCGAALVSEEIGCEKTPEEFVQKMVEVFREVRRVLRDDGTLWLNLGDTYAGSSSSGGTGSLDGSPRREARMFQRGGGQGTTGNLGQADRGNEQGHGPALKSLPSGNLVGVPWRVALALQADGWVLRQDLIWAKPSPMPESVKNRCTKAHEYVFLMTKSMNYYYDSEAIKEEAVESGWGRQRDAGSGSGTRIYGNKAELVGNDRNDYNDGGALLNRVKSNKRSVWRVSSQGYAGAHFATFPPKLIEPMILAGTSAHGACANCGAPWRRVVEERQLTRERPNDYVKRNGQEGTGSSCANSVAGVEVKTIGWEPSCKCATKATRPCVVLDPFIGSGTTCCVSLENGRASIGIDLSETYLKENAVRRIEGELLQRPGLVHLVPGRSTEAVKVGKELLFS